MTDIRTGSEVAQAVIEEYDRATAKFEQFNSAHEGYAVILEELNELWDEVRRRNANPVLMRMEAIQVAAMAIRFVVDVCPGSEDESD